MNEGDWVTYQSRRIIRTRLWRPQPGHLFCRSKLGLLSLWSGVLRSPWKYIIVDIGLLRKADKISLSNSPTITAYRVLLFYLIVQWTCSFPSPTLSHPRRPRCLPIRTPLAIQEVAEALAQLLERKPHEYVSSSTILRRCSSPLISDSSSFDDNITHIHGVAHSFRLSLSNCHDSSFASLLALQKIIA